MGRRATGWLVWLVAATALGVSCGTKERDFNEGEAGAGSSGEGGIAGVGASGAGGGTAAVSGGGSAGVGEGGAGADFGASGGDGRPGGGSAGESGSSQGGEGGGACGGAPCECEVGDTRSCADAGAKGSCAKGTQTCNSDGQWEACSVAPRPNDTCATGNDDDCDGVVNEGCPCVEATTRPCSQAGLVGPCATGTQTCSADGGWGPCSIRPAAEDTCAQGNNANCAGPPNEGCICIVGVTTRSCGTCDDGTQTCTNGKTGQYGACAGATSLRTFFRDADGDGHGSSTVTTTGCGAPPAGYITGPSDDCYDQNELANPDQEDDFEDDRGDGSWDYDCSGREEPTFTTASQIGVAGCMGACGSTCVSTGPGRVGSTPPCGGTLAFIAGCNFACPSPPAPGCQGVQMQLSQLCR